MPLTAAALEPTKSKDEISVAYDEDISLLRAGRAGRDIFCYVARNLTKGGIYSVELFEDDKAVPHGWCDCVASVVCKHIKSALNHLRVRIPGFGKAVFDPQGETNVDTESN